MKHLIAAIRETSIADCYERVKCAHDYLVASGRKATELFGKIGDAANWGTTAKRVQVKVGDGRPQDVGEAVEYHSLIEVINQTATVERLLDVLAWAQTEKSPVVGFQDVVVCHPCTSAATDISRWENDLVLRDNSGREARFEISDIASTSDSNRKHRKDLQSLRLIDANGSILEPQRSSPRLFVAVSQEFSSYVRQCTPAWKRAGGIGYTEVKETGLTRVFELTRAYGAHA